MKRSESNPVDDAGLDEKIADILGHAERMFLATSVDGISSGASVFFARDGHDLLFFTFNPSRKAEQIRINPQVQAVIWPATQNGIRGLQIEGHCRQIWHPEEQRRAREKILAVTEAFRSYMDDPFLNENRVVGYYRIRPTLTKYVDFHANPQFQWREYPENQTGVTQAMWESVVNRLRLWNRAVRAPFFTASLVPVLLGAGIVYDDLARAGEAIAWNWKVFWLALLGAILAQAGTNLANDYGDHTSRNDEFNKVPSPFNGGSRVIQAGLLAPWKVLLASMLCFALTVGIGLYLNDLIGGAFFASTPLLWAGIAGCILGIAYTLGPVRLSYRGLGEIAIAIGFGPVIVLGMHYVMSADATSQWLWGRPLCASLPIALLVMLIVWINQFQDAPADAKANKRTWVVRIGEQAGDGFRYERALKVYRFFNGLAFASIAGLGILGLAGSTLGTPYAFLALATIPLFVYASRQADAWLERWNKPDADRQRQPFAHRPAARGRLLAIIPCGSLPGQGVVSRFPPGPVALRRHTRQHRDNKYHDLVATQRQPADGGPRTQANQPPTDTEEDRATHQTRIHVATGRYLESFAKHRNTLHAGNPVGDCHYRQSACHDERQARIPVPRHIEESQNLGRIDHARDRQAETEDGSGSERNEHARHLSPPGGARRRP